MSKKMVARNGVASSTFELPYQLDSARIGGKSGRAHGNVLLFIVIIHLRNKLLMFSYFSHSLASFAMWYALWTIRQTLFHYENVNSLI